eukprot:CAMPEP_0171073870 /NCGR_PEP_ID=MMETSP0766_2-20121228/11776_1 /TAXON_ID=439317 /ORGANISM="Gambierdiscus australes, Strain CAWD 149" /LENGTH=179 /DNA_ID=CAMNT_0011530603 /DNA_START=50 /DNA_END=589 /DNA_ORIENTATION=+
MVSVAGLGKLLPWHPMNKLLVTTFETTAGPFFGLPARPLRLAVGIVELVAGLGLLVGLWSVQTGDAQKHVDLLLILDGVGLATVLVQAMVFHAVVEGAGQIFPYGVMIILLCTFVGCRLQMTPLRSLGPSCEFLAIRFLYVCITGLLLSLFARRAWGASTETLVANNKKIKEMQAQLMG